ncbi:MAG TPA: hypothetical protein PLU22_20975, partial [Polyangiaceae bacterium]|nr:hypothetical protein [Polyangiaceae bacterium]
MASDLPGQQTPASDTSLAMTWRRDGLIAVGLPLAAGVAVRGYGGSATGDDTFIYMRYVAHALAGDGYVFNVGEASYGFTSALWVLVMTPIAALGGNRVEVWQWASSLMFAASSVVVFGRLRWGGVGATRATALAVVSLLEPHTFRWASSGMENGLTALVLALVVSLIHQPEAVPERFRLWVG